MPNSSDPIGAELRRIRLSLGLSLGQVEARSGGRFKQVVVGSWERGDRSISSRQHAALLDFYGYKLAAVPKDLPVDVLTRVRHYLETSLGLLKVQP